MQDLQLRGHRRGRQDIIQKAAGEAPVCIANAVADALGVAEVSLPLTAERVLEIVRRRGQ
jgi:hypothetical protein